MDPLRFLNHFMLLLSNFLAEIELKSTLQQNHIINAKNIQILIAQKRLQILLVSYLHKLFKAINLILTSCVLSIARFVLGVYVGISWCVLATFIFIAAVKGVRTLVL